MHPRTPKYPKLTLREILTRAQAFESMRRNMPPKLAARLLNAPLRLLTKAAALLRALGSIQAVLERANELQTNNLHIIYASTITPQSTEPLDKLILQTRERLIAEFANNPEIHTTLNLAYLLYNFLTRQLNPDWLLTASTELLTKIKYLPCIICQTEPPSQGNHIIYHNHVPLPVCPNCSSIPPTAEHLAQYLPVLWSITRELDYTLDKLTAQP